MPRAKRDKTTGLPLPSPVVPASNVCVRLTIPNAPEYRQALRGFIADLGKPWTWAQTEGGSKDPAYTAAELWRAAAATMVYTDDCEDEMSCADVANCIETDEAVAEALLTSEAVSANVITTINSSNVVQEIIYNTSTVGTPMSAPERNSSVTGATLCDYDVLFGSIGELIGQLDQNNRDFLEIIEVGTNTRERVTKVISAIPLVGQFPADEALDFVDKLQSEILENYEAQWTTSLRDEYKCAIFCLAKETENCEVTFQMLVEYFNDRIGTSLEPINFFGAVAQYFILGTWAGTTVVDIMMLIQLSAWQEASSWTGIPLRTLQTVGLLGANNPDPDWEILCLDCAPDTFCTTGTLKDFRLDMTGWTIPNSRGTWLEGQGVKRSEGAVTFISLERAGNFPVSKLRVHTTSGEMGTLNLFRRTSSSNEAKGTSSTPVAVGDGTFIYEIVPPSWPTSGMLAMAFRFDKSPSIPLSAFVIEACIEG